MLVVKLCALTQVVVNVVSQVDIGPQLEVVDKYIARISRKLSAMERINRQCETVFTEKSAFSDNVLELGNRTCDVAIENVAKRLESVRDRLHGVVKTVAVVDLHERDQRENRVCIDSSDSLLQCFHSFEGEPIDQTAAQIVCLQELLWTFKPVDPKSRSDRDRIRDLIDLNNLHRPPSGKRVRKEYRSLTYEERIRFHNALKRLHKDGMIAVFGRIHAEASVHAHKGPAFLPWHRAFLTVFEEALRRMDPSVSLPYWDSTVDYDMDNPVNSVIWTEQFFGNGAGEVNTGPFSEWVTHNGRLERSFGQRSRLMSKMDVDSVLSHCHYANISHPTSKTALEYFHNGVHTWVGGDMAYINSAAYDPVFYMHHCFVDYIWERFRQGQRHVCNVDPETDYVAREFVSGNHRPERQMHGLEFYDVSDGLADWWTNGDRRWFSYESAPVCPYCGDAHSLVCDVEIERCVPNSRLQELVDVIIEPHIAEEPTTEGFNAKIVFGTSPNLPGVRTLKQPMGSDTVVMLDGESPELIPAVLAADLAKEAEMIPKNRGHSFDGPHNDGRTLDTAFTDALDAADNKRKRRR